MEFNHQIYKIYKAIFSNIVICENSLYNYRKILSPKNKGLVTAFSVPSPSFQSGWSETIFEGWVNGLGRIRLISGSLGWACVVWSYNRSWLHSCVCNSLGFDFCTLFSFNRNCFVIKKKKVILYKNIHYYFIFYFSNSYFILNQVS